MPHSQPATILIAEDEPASRRLLATCLRQAGYPGIGIRQEDMSLLFQPFSRLYLETYAIEGSGIGLALSKQLTEAMGGSIQVSSEKTRAARSLLNSRSPLKQDCRLPNRSRSTMKSRPKPCYFILRTVRHTSG